VSERPTFALACPACRAELCSREDSATCVACGREYKRTDGIWRFLLDPCAHTALLRQYRTVRAAEGWGSDDASYYRALPRVRADDPQRAIWRMRARHFRALLKWLPTTTLRSLDAGAGNGWLSNQLAHRGHTVAALDVSDDTRDGLGAHVHYAEHVKCYQAEFARLPFADAQFDLVIFNASLHYADALAPTLVEARRVLRADGRIVVMDSPFYDDVRSGTEMVREREQDFEHRHGITQPVRTLGFLTWPALQCAAAEVHVRITSLIENDGWQSRLQHTWTRWRIGRESARFPLIVMERD